ncbi:PEP/pyruvate-binding domain-containing protein [Nonomuraea sp. NPDC050691]|uniref:PEP/pyruvate-binding domain-containing protein n=1 Tax=Nonomuraea sp. NPDC050691 TaxID=3155661 RepID=UPI0033E3519D
MDKTLPRTSVVPATLDVPLTVPTFMKLAGRLAGFPFVKVVVDLEKAQFHVIDSTGNPLHVHYIAEHILGVPAENLLRDIDAFNHDVYVRPDRRFLLGLLALHRRRQGDGDGEERVFLSLETVEADTMSADMLLSFYRHVRAHLHPSVPLFLKPANHLQESHVAGIPEEELPRLLAHELLSQAPFVPLNSGTAHGRLRLFASAADYRAAAGSVEWHDIIVMPRVPDDIPRVTGLVNTEHTTPLSHTNVLATGWGIPNAIQTDLLDRPGLADLDGGWVRYEVAPDAPGVLIEAADPPAGLDSRPPWTAERVALERPETAAAEIIPLSWLRMGDHYRYGTKAANLGEVCQVLEHGSRRWLGFYQIPRPPRSDLLSYLAGRLGVTGPADDATLSAAAERLMRQHVEVPRGIALPFSLQRQFLESSPRIQQTIGRLKMAVEAGTHHVEDICAELQQMIVETRLPSDLLRRIDDAIVTHLSGVGQFVVRSSSNAEDLAGFSAAGVYESVAHARTLESIADGVKEVWSSLVSARSVRLREQAGIPLEDCYMGVIVQEWVDVPLGGVLVTCNPADPRDFRNVYVNISLGSVADVVTGTGDPLQHLYNTVEGGGRTISLGSARSDLAPATKDSLARLALIGRLLQSHFSPDYLYGVPVDIEWALDGDRIKLLQIRPYRPTS